MTPQTTDAPPKPPHPSSSSPSPPPRVVWGEAIGAAVLATVLLSLWLGTGAMLFDNDSLYADVARSMAREGTWLDPQIHGVPFLDKPPLFFWILGVFMEVFGDSIAILRLPAALFGGATVGAVVYGARRSGLSRLGAAIGAAGVLSVPLFGEYARRVYMEVPVAFCVLGAILAFQHGMTGLGAEEGRAGADPRAFLVAGLMAGMGFMFKSLVGLFGVIPFALLLLVERRWELLRSGWLWGGVGIALLLVVPWHGYQLITNTDAFLQFTWKLHVEDQIFDAQPWSTGPPWFYATKLVFDEPALGALMLIGLGGAISRAVAARQGEAKGLSPLDRHLVLALLVALAIFSASETKKLLYLIPLIPIAALLVARVLGEMRAPIQGAVLAAVVLMGIRTVPVYHPSGPFLHGVSDQIPVATAIRDASREGETIRILDDYFSTVQYYAERRAESYWQKPTLVQQTQRIPYIRFGDNMYHVPPPKVVETMVRDKPGVWVVRPDLWVHLKPALGDRAKVLFVPEGCTADSDKDTGACVVLRTGS